MYIPSYFGEKQSMPKFPKNRHFLPPDTHTCVCVSGGKKCLFFGNFGVLCFPETPILRFALFPYYRRISEMFLFVNSSFNDTKKCISFRCHHRIDFSIKRFDVPLINSSLVKQISAFMT